MNISLDLAVTIRTSDFIQNLTVESEEMENCLGFER